MRVCRIVACGDLLYIAVAETAVPSEMSGTCKCRALSVMRCENGKNVVRLLRACKLTSDSHQAEQYSHPSFGSAQDVPLLRTKLHIPPSSQNWHRPFTQELNLLSRPLQSA
jgi:hypothetical protein